MGKIAFVFSGQGAQYPGMGRDLYEYSKAFKEVFDMADKDVLDICFNGPEDLLNSTIYTQPCMFFMDLACAKALEEQGIFAEGVAGFSIGELAALAYAKALTPKLAYETVLFRASAMGQCALQHIGVMYAVLGLDDESVKELCGQLTQCYPVNYNCPNQVVVSMLNIEEEKFQELAKKYGAKTIKLNVSGAFHSPFMKAASDKLECFLKDKGFRASDVPVYSNVTARPYGKDFSLLCQQVSSPVLWNDTILNMISDGFDVFIELGAKGVLTNMIKRINPDVRVLNVYDKKSLLQVVEELNA